MKNIIIALLMIPVFGFSQIDTGVYRADIYRFDGIDTPERKYSPIYDTIKVVMLVCDTSHWNYVDSGVVNNKFVELARSGNRYNYSVQWQFGYEVKEKIEVGVKTFDKDGNDWTGSMLIVGIAYISVPQYKFKHIEYLGENKKTLSKNIVVWQSKNR